MDKDLQTTETQTEVRLGDRNQRLWGCGCRGRKSTKREEMQERKQERGNNRKGNTEEEEEAGKRRKSRMCKWMMEMCQKREEEEHEAGKREEGAIRLSEK